MTYTPLDCAPRQFGIVSGPDEPEPIVVAWGQQFADGAVAVLRVPGGRQVLDVSSAEAALKLVNLLGFGPVALVWTTPLAEGV